MKMRTMKVEIDGKMRDVFVFEGMWEYISYYGSDITHYALDPYPFRGEKIIVAFRPINDEDFSTRSSDMLEIDSSYCQYVNWGEDDYCMIPEADLEAEFWTVYEWDGIGGYNSTGAIFQTEEEARKEV